jgi:hypothetical protein
MLALFGSLLFPRGALALPLAPAEVCRAYPASPACASGSAPDCTLCHTTPPARNAFGRQVEAALGLPTSVTPEAFAAALGPALQAVEALDADGDGATNLEELLAGTRPADGASAPPEGACPGPGEDLGYDPCAPDLRFTHRKLSLDFCRRSPTREERAAFAAATDKAAFLDDVLARCLDSEAWRGRDGVVWRLAHAKIQPLQSIKSGENAGDIPLADYLDDYNLFVYVHTDDRDVRELVTADYHVAREDGPPTRYTPFRRSPQEDFRERGIAGVQPLDIERRAGMITTRWFQMSNTMFTGLPRTTAAQAYRAYLGLDIAKMEGLFDVPGEPADYDAKGVDAPECARCHATLDPLTYPFSRYSGIGGEEPRATPYAYVADRPERFTHVEGERFAETPEAGWIFGQPVRDLREWARVAANSEAFARAVVMDYWRLLIGRAPTPAEAPEVNQLVEDLMTTHAYRVEAMLFDLVKTEAYRVP